MYSRNQRLALSRLLDVDAQPQPQEEVNSHGHVYHLQAALQSLRSRVDQIKIIFQTKQNKKRDGGTRLAAQTDLIIATMLLSNPTNAGI